MHQNGRHRHRYSALNNQDPESCHLSVNLYQSIDLLQVKEENADAIDEWMNLI